MTWQSVSVAAPWTIHVIEMHLQQAVNAIRPYRHTSVSGAVRDALCHIGLKAEAAMDSADMQNCRTWICPPTGQYNPTRSIVQILVLTMTEIYWRRGRFKYTNELLNLRALKFSPVNKIHTFQCIGKLFCVEFRRYPLKFHTKYLTHTLKDMIFIQHWNSKGS